MKINKISDRFQYVREKTKISIYLIITLLCFQSVSAQYAAYEKVVKQGDDKYQSGVTNLSNKRYDIAITNFNDAIRYYGNAKKAPTIPSNSETILNSKIADCRAKITQANEQKAQSLKSVQQKTEPTPSLTISSKELHFTASDSVLHLTINTNIKEWKLDTVMLPSWCESSRLDGNNILVTVQRNNTAKIRSCSFEVIAGTLKEKVEVFQEALDVNLKVSRNELSFYADDDETNSLSIGIDCNVDWEIQKNSDPEIVGVETVEDSVKVYMKVPNKDQHRREYAFEIVAGETTPVKITIYHESESRKTALTTKATTYKNETAATNNQQTKLTTETKRGTLSESKMPSLQDGSKNRTTGTLLIVAGALMPVAGAGAGYFIRTDKIERDGNNIYQRTYNKIIPFAIVGAAVGTGLVVWGIKMNSTGAKTANQVFNDYYINNNTAESTIQKLNLMFTFDGVGLSYNF